MDWRTKNNVEYFEMEREDGRNFPIEFFMPVTLDERIECFQTEVVEVLGYPTYCFECLWFWNDYYDWVNS
ncbi:hypothetical protein NUACC26_086210 [Scytonema sp. NUACC26]